MGTIQPWANARERLPRTQLQLGLFHIQSGIYNLSGERRERISRVSFLFVPGQDLLSQTLRQVLGILNPQETNPLPAYAGALLETI